MTCRSMTGFGQASLQGEAVNVKVEMRSVNHRFAEFAIRLPRELLALEEDVKACLQNRLARGRVDVLVQVEWTARAQRVDVDWDLLDALVACAREAALRYGQPADSVSAGSWLTFPGVLQVGPASQAWDSIRGDVLRAVDQACQALVAMREREGGRLETILRDGLARLETWVSRMTELAPRAVTTYERRLRERLAALSEAVDEQRLWTEVAIYADRAAVDEELARLRSHLDEFRAALDGGSPVGRRLDFLVQEMHREANTIGAKSQDVELSKAVVEAKVVIEQLREQAQNIE